MLGHQLHVCNTQEPFSLCVPKFLHKDLAVGLWQTKNELVPLVMVISAYMADTNKNVWPSTLVPCLKHCERQNIQALILSDANSYSNLWGMPKTNERGKKLEDLIVTQGREKDFMENGKLSHRVAQKHTHEVPAYAI